MAKESSEIKLSGAQHRAWLLAKWYLLELMNYPSKSFGHAL
jgi:hypothetical protein